MAEFADLPEHRATGRIAEIYDEIRIYGAVPYVSSLQRQLATIPGCLEWVWDAVRPSFIDGRVPRAAWGAVEDLDLPSIAPMPRPALRVLGVDAMGESALHSIYETFLRASPVNMVTASLMVCMLEGLPTPKKASLSDDMPTWQPPSPPQALPPFPLDNELGPDIRRLLELFEVDMDGVRSCRAYTGSWRTGRNILPMWPSKSCRSCSVTTSSVSVRKSYRGLIQLCRYLLGVYQLDRCPVILRPSMHCAARCGSIWS